MSVIAAVAEFERDLLIERTLSGLTRAKASGRPLGRPKSLGNTQAASALEMLSTGLSVAEVARRMNTSRQTILRIRDRAQAVSA